MKRERDSAFNNAVCQRTKELRVALCGKRGRSKLAAMLGVTPSTYHYYERGRALPADLIVRLCNMANVNLEWFLLGTGPKHRARKGVCAVAGAKAASKKRGVRRKR